MYHVELGSFHLTVQTNVLNVDHQSHTALMEMNIHVVVDIATDYFLYSLVRAENVRITQILYFVYLSFGFDTGPKYCSSRM